MFFELKLTASEFMIVCINTVCLVIFHKNKLHPHLNFEEIEIWYVKAKMAPGTERRFPTPKQKYMQTRKVWRPSCLPGNLTMTT